MCCIFRSRILLSAAVLALAALFLAHPDTAAAGFEQGVRLCMHTLLPALFPFFVACGLLTSAVGRKGGFAAALLLSWLGGYAVCAGLVRDLRIQGKLSPFRANILLLLGCCSGPGFVVGSIGGQLLGSVPMGLLLYGAQLVANLACAALLWPLAKRWSIDRPLPAPAKTPAPQGLPQAIAQAVDSSLCVCGTVVFFRMVQTTLTASLVLPSSAAPFLSAFWEISSGCADFARLGGSATLYGLCLCLSGLSVSVFVQLQSLLEGTADLRLLALSRALHLPLLLLLVKFLAPRLPGETAVFSSLAPRVVTMNRTAPDTAFVVFLFLCAVLYKTRKKNYNRSIRG